MLRGQSRIPTIQDPRIRRNSVLAFPVGGALTVDNTGTIVITLATNSGLVQTSGLSVSLVSGGGILVNSSGLYLDTVHTVTVYASGTAYQITTSFAQIIFGTTSPVVTLDRAGTWLIKARARVDRNGIHINVDHVVSLKLRRSNNTASDITNAATAYDDIAHTASDVETEGLFPFPEVVYTTANNNDIIQMWIMIDQAAVSGSHDVVEADIQAIFLH
jgi:hypothetical protein